MGGFPTSTTGGDHLMNTEEPADGNTPTDVRMIHAQRTHDGFAVADQEGPSMLG